MIRTKKRYVVNFPAHLADCEFNYRRLTRLMPGWLIDSEIDTVENKTLNPSKWKLIVGHSKETEIAVVMTVSESAKYTTTLQLAVYPSRHSHYSWSQFLQSAAIEKEALAGSSLSMDSGDKKGFTEGLCEYSIQVRLYHDATVAEVIGWQGQKRFQPRNDYPNKKMYQTDEKAQLNRFLGELLERCLRDGRVLDEIAILHE